MTSFRSVLTPTRIALVFRALGASAEFTDGVVGDLLEEFADREARDGVAAAESWMAREALRNLPAAARDAWRVLGWRDARVLLSHALLAYVLVAIGSLIGATMVLSTLHAIGVPFSVPPAASGNPLWVLSWLPVVVLEAVAMGCVAAWVDRTRPLACAVVMSLCWLTAHALMFALDPKTPLWFFLTVPTTIAAGVMAGAGARLWHMDSRSTPDGATT